MHSMHYCMTLRRKSGHGHDNYLFSGRFLDYVVYDNASPLGFKPYVRASATPLFQAAGSTTRRVSWYWRLSGCIIDRAVIDKWYYFVPEHLHQRGEVVGGCRGAGAHGRVWRGGRVFSGARARGARGRLRHTRRPAPAPARPGRALLYAREGGEFPVPPYSTPDTPFPVPCPMSPAPKLHGHYIFLFAFDIRWRLISYFFLLILDHTLSVL